MGVRRLALRIVAGLVLVVCCLAAYGLFWPAPGDVARMHCRPGDGGDCAEASGRVVYMQSGAPGKQVHAVLLSRRSLTLPGIVAIKLPALRDRPPGLGIGRWVSVVGAEVVGSHGRHDIHVVRMATGDSELRCAWGRNPIDCHVANATASLSR